MKMSGHNSKVGRSGEQLVATYLERHGYQVMTQNFSWHHHGEIDIIARKGEYLACVEVKTRYNTAVPFEHLVPRSKQSRIIKTAQYFIQQKKMFDVVVRFDVAFVDMTQRPVAVEYIEHAFQT